MKSLLRLNYLQHEFENLSYLADENIHPSIVAFLRTEGYAVKDVKEENLNGSSDKFLLDLANNENRIILTHDSDFGTIVFTQQIDFKGIIYLRPGHFDPTFTISTLKSLFMNDFSVTSPFIIVAENKGDSVKIRIRQF